MISPELHAQIRRLFFAEHWRFNTIAAQLGVHHDTVRRAVETATLGSAPSSRWQRRWWMIPPGPQTGSPRYSRSSTHAIPNISSRRFLNFRHADSNSHSKCATSP